MLLSNAGLAFEATTADIDERAIQQGSKLSAPGEIAALLAREKARWIEAFHDSFFAALFGQKPIAGALGPNIFIPSAC